MSTASPGKSISSPGHSVRPAPAESPTWRWSRSKPSIRPTHLEPPSPSPPVGRELRRVRRGTAPRCPCLLRAARASFCIDGSAPASQPDRNARGSRVQWKTDEALVATLVDEATALERSARPWTSQSEDVLSGWRHLGDRLGTAAALGSLGLEASRIGAFDVAARQYDESLAILRELGFQSRLAWTLVAKGDVECSRGQYPLAEQAYAEALGLFESLQLHQGATRARLDLARVVVARLEVHRASAFSGARRPMPSAEIMDEDDLYAYLVRCAGLALARGDAETAAKLVGATQIRSKMPEPTVHVERARVQGRKRGEALFAAAAQAGQSMRLQSALEVAACIPESDAHTQATDRRSITLTAREREVVALLALGYRDQEIADALVMTRATASWHVRNVLSKLRLSRVQVAVWAAREGLVAI